MKEIKGPLAHGAVKSPIFSSSDHEPFNYAVHFGATFGDEDYPVVYYDSNIKKLHEWLSEVVNKMEKDGYEFK